MVQKDTSFGFAFFFWMGKKPGEQDTFKDSPLEHSRSILDVVSVGQNAVGWDACKLNY